ncbi:MAG: GntR family transcriptional regulator [Ruminococcaceae bacterium]|nr:GntR family transcriptional regulator [Oscillospiraceae bacterium]
MINRKNHIPLYLQLANLLREQIKTGVIPEGSKLPSETEMIRQYSLSRLTIRDALAVLTNEGLIEKHHGKGTFCKTNILQNQYKIDVLLNLTDVYFVPHYLQSICGVLERCNATVALHDTQNSADTICTYLEKILVEGTDGILIQPSPDALQPPEKLVRLFEQLYAAGIPYIMVDSSYTSVPQSYAIMDEVKAGAIAAEHFQQLGHTHLCMIALENYADSELRMQGFANALEHSPPYRINYSPSLAEDLSVMLAQRPDITGIFCHNDEIAKECYKILNQLGISIPDQISVISVDDTVIASALTPPLTSIVHPKTLLGEASANGLIAIISGKEVWPYQKIFEPALHRRLSCKKQNG